MTSPESVDILDTGGRLPRFWSEDVLYFANVLRLFFGNEGQMRELRETVGEVESYGGRLVPVLSLLYGGEHNTLVLEHRPAEAFCRYFRDGLGLRLPELRLLAHEEYEAFGRCWEAQGAGKVDGVECGAEWLAAYRGHPAQRVDGYVTDEILIAIASALHKPTVTTPRGWWKANNKLLLHRFLEGAGLPVIPTEIAGSVAEVPGALRALAHTGFRSAVLKSQIGASGVGMKKWEDLGQVPDELSAEIPEHFFFEGEIMVQGWVRPGWNGILAIHSPSVQFFATGEQVCLYDVTEQILSRESVHEGNVAPPPYLERIQGLRQELLRQAGLVGAWLSAEGYRGPGSVDFLVAEKAGQAVPDVFVCEANARVTGATYPSVLARHFAPQGAWLMRNLRLEQPLRGAEVLDLLQRNGHLYAPGRKSGVLPVNANYGADDMVHKGQFLCLGPSTGECLGCLVAAEHDLPVMLTPEAEGD